MEREWYDDGFTMEEQRELRRNSIQFKCNLTEKFQAESADKLIKSLRIKIGESESYIQELEESNKNLKETVEKLNARVKELNNKYSKDVAKLMEAPVFKKLQEKNSELKKKIKMLEDIRNKLIYQLSNEKLS